MKNNQPSLNDLIFEMVWKISLRYLLKSKQSTTAENLLKNMDSFISI